MAKNNVELEAQIRENVDPAKLRKTGLIPAVVYGRKVKPLSVAVDSKLFTKYVLRSESELNLIFNLKINDNGKSQVLPVITCDLQINPLTDQIIHLDFKHIVMDEEIRTKVPVELTGVPVGVKDDGGVLVHGLREIELKCLPGEIPDKFEIDVSGLTIGHSLHVSDLKVSDKIHILSPAAEMIANVSAPTKDEEVSPPPSPLEAAAAAEGAPAAGAAPAEGAPAAGAASPAAKSGAAAPKSEKAAPEAKK